MQRVTEPELMDDAAQALAYSQADFFEPNRQFINRLHQQLPVSISGQCLDLGCGPGDICFELASRFPKLLILGIDGAKQMLELAKEKLNQRPGAQRVRFEQHIIPTIELPNAYFDVITSNSLLHHLHNPDVLWKTIKQCAKPGGDILIMDLTRPESAEAAAAIVKQYAAGEPEILQQDLYNSLCAAFTPAEVAHQLSTAELSHLQIQTVSDRHLTISGQLKP